MMATSMMRKMRLDEFKHMMKMPEHKTMRQREIER